MRQSCTVRAEGLQKFQEDQGLDCIRRLALCLCLQQLLGWVGRYSLLLGTLKLKDRVSSTM